MQPPELLQVFIEPLERAGLRYFVTGSVATTFYGEPRLTHDIDVVIQLAVREVAGFVALFPEADYYVPPLEVIRVELGRRAFGHFNLIHHASGLKADLYPDLKEPLHVWAFQHRQRIELGPGRGLWLAPPEYVILRKLEYFREGGSQKHLEDLRKMLDQPELVLDRRFLGEQIRQRGLGEPWGALDRGSPDDGGQGGGP